MSSRICLQLLIVAYIGGFINASSFALCLLFCGSNSQSFFSVTLLLWLNSPVLMSASQAAASFSSAFVVVITLSLVSPTSTCSSRSWRCTPLRAATKPSPPAPPTSLCSFYLLYGSIPFIYMMPKSSYSTDQNKVASVFYTVVNPMLNPLIYSLRSNEIKGALKRQFGRKMFS